MHVKGSWNENFELPSLHFVRYLEAKFQASIQLKKEDARRHSDYTRYRYSATLHSSNKKLKKKFGFL